MIQHEFDDFKAIHNKRRAIDKLIAYTKQIGLIAKSIDTLIASVDPNDQSNKVFAQSLVRLASRMKDVNKIGLVSNLDKIDKAIYNEIEEILQLAELSEESFFKLYPNLDPQISSSYQKIIGEIQNFIRKTQTDLVIRHELNDRGFLVESFHLPLNLHQLKEKADSMRMKEQTYKFKIQNHIQDLIKDARKVMLKKDYPEDIKLQLGIVIKELMISMDELNSDQVDDGFEFQVDEYELESDEISNNTESNTDNSPDVAVSKADQDSNIIQKDKPYVHNRASRKVTSIHANNAKPKSRSKQKATPKPSWYKLIKAWFNTPWDVSWDEIKKESSRID